MFSEELAGFELFVTIQTFPYLSELVFADFLDISDEFLDLFT